MENHELLDRMELLFPYDARFADLRRAYIDKDSNSIHRLINEFYGDGLDNIRKAIRDDNWHQLFHYVSGMQKMEFKPPKDIEPEDLRKFLLEDNTWSMYRLMLHLQDTMFIRAIKSMHGMGMEWDSDCLSQGQIKSKRWIIDELKTLDLDLGVVFLCAGWYGLLATMLFENNIPMKHCLSFDIDEPASHVAFTFNKPWLIDEWRFYAVVEDIHNVDFSGYYWKPWSNKQQMEVGPIYVEPDTIINTSCEHIENFDTWYEGIPEGKLVILQSNDYEDVKEHVNIHPDLDSFARQTPLSEELYSGELELDNYTRFMRIGYK